MPTACRIYAARSTAWLLLGVMLTLVSCAAQQTPGASPHALTAVDASLTPTLLPPQPGTATVLAQAAQCAHALSATAMPEETSSLSGIVLPAQTYLVGTSARGADGPTTSFEEQTWAACTPGMSPEAVRAFFRVRAPTAGWVQSATYPYQAKPIAACGDAYCWKQRVAGTQTTSYLSLEDVHTSGALALYTLRLADYTA